MSLYQESPTARPTQFGRIFRPDAEWLDKGPAEAPLDADLPLVDAHHHLWDKPISTYLVREFAAEIAASGHRVLRSVYIQSSSMYRQGATPAWQPVGEVEYAAGQAAMSESGQFGACRVAAAIVGYADLRLGAAVREVLQAQLSVGGGRFRGVRFSSAWDESPSIGNSHDWSRAGLLREPAVVEGARSLADLDLSLDAWAFHPQLDDIADLADAVPSLRIVVDHCGGALGYGPYAGRRDEVFAAWRTRMADLSRRPRIHVKLGGMMMRLAAIDYLNAPRPPSSQELADAWRPYIETCIELFGPARCMFESNFPVEKMGVGYGVLWNAFKRIAAGASAQDRADLFSGSADRFYRISEVA
jgi:L-fuconolactonase